MHYLIGQNYVRGIIRTRIRETRSGLPVEMTGEYELQPDNIGIYSNIGTLRGDLDHDRHHRLNTKTIV